MIFIWLFCFLPQKSQKMARKIANRSKLHFVKKFLKHWISCHLHAPSQSSKLYRFKNFINLMKQDGEYLTVEPEYDQCYNFFRDLNPKKWKTKNKKKELKPLKNDLNRIFNEKMEKARQFLLETDITSQFTAHDKQRGAQIQLYNVNYVQNAKTEDNKSHEQITKELNNIFNDDKKMAELIKYQLKKQLYEKLYGF